MKQNQVIALLFLIIIFIKPGYGLNTWREISSGTSEDLNLVEFFNTNEGWIKGDNGTYLMTANGGNTWYSISSETTDSLEKVQFVSSQCGFGYYQISSTDMYNVYHFYKTTNGGKSWTVHDLKDALYLDGNTNHSIRNIYFSDETHGWIRYSYTILSNFHYRYLYTNDGGNTWIQGAFPIPFIEGQRINDLKAYNSTHNWCTGEVWFQNGKEGKVLFSSNENTWVEVYQSYSFTPLTIYPFDQNHIWFATDQIAPDNYLEWFRTINNGQDWIEVTAIPDIASLSFSNLNEGWGIKNSRIFHTMDGGDTWDSLTIDLSHQYNEITTNNSNCWIVGDNGLVLTNKQNSQQISDHTSTAFTDDFETTDTNGWAFADSSRWTVGDAQGRNALFINTSNYPNGSLGEMAIINTRDFDDFTFTCKVASLENLSSNAYADYAFVFDYRNPTDYKYVMINKTGSETGLYQITSQGETAISNNAGSWISDNNYHDFQCTKIGNEIWVYVDGLEVLNATFAIEGAAGQIGVGSYNDAAAFDDVVVKVAPEDMQPYSRYASIEKVGQAILDTSCHNSRAASFGDYNADGYPELFIANSSDTQNQLLLNTNGNYSPLVSSPIVSAANSSSGGLWGDFDNDGMMDFLTIHDAGISNQLFRNTGSGFTEITSDIVSNDGSNSNFGAWGDYDGDGDLDLYVANSGRNKLYNNQGNGSFTEIDTGAVVTDDSPSTTAIWSDLDSDGDLDLFVANYDANNVIYFNQQNSYFTRTPFNATYTSMGAALGDYDNDGDLDIFVANLLDRNEFYENLGNGEFTDVDLGTMTTESRFSTNCTFQDMNLDGYLDLIIANAYADYNYCMINNGQKEFTGYIIDNRYSMGLTSADYDNDGDQDLFFANEFEANRLYENTQTNGNHWLKILCQGIQSNTSGFGCKVSIKTAVNDSARWQYREITGQACNGSQSDLYAHFGLSSATAIDSIRIQWPSGIVWDTVHVAANQSLIISERQTSPVVAPIANFGADTTWGFDSLTVNFTDSSTGSINIWHWDFGDGTTSSLQNPIHTYHSVDTFTVTLTVSGPAGTDSRTKENLIQIQYAPPKAHFGLKQVVGPPPLTVEFVDSSYGIITSCIWDFGDGDTSQVRNPIHTYTEPDTYSVSLTVSGPGGTNTLVLNNLIIVQETVGLIDISTLPTDFALLPVYPNPFNPMANIKFALPKQENVQIQIYNIRGELMEQINLGLKDAGYHHWAWDANKFSTGAYFVSIRAGAFHEVRKCVLMK